jgi:hypothetical protein
VNGEEITFLSEEKSGNSGGKVTGRDCTAKSDGVFEMALFESVENKE